MHSTVITIEKGSKGSFGTQGKKAYNFVIEADYISTETGAFDPTYRIQQSHKEITILRDGIPHARVKYSRRSGKWSSSFLFTDDLSLRLQLHTQSFSCLKEYVLSIKAQDIFIAQFRVTRSRIASYRSFPLHHECGTILATKELETRMFIFDEKIDHNEATHEVALEDSFGNIFFNRNLLALDDQITDEKLADLCSLYQLSVYKEMLSEKIDPYSTLCETCAVVIRAKGVEQWDRFALERNKYDQPSILNLDRFR